MRDERTLDVGAQLRQLVQLNEGAKVVFTRSHAVNLLAIDAIVRSRLAGDAVRGFAEVSTQMRAWSSDLYARMQSLQESTTDVVATINPVATASVVVCRRAAMSEERTSLGP